MTIATIVEGKELLETVVVSLAASVGLTFAFSVAIWGVARFADLSRSEKPLAAATVAAVAGLAMVAVGAALVAGIIVMTSK
jgi:hypothetical protein